MTIGNTPDSSIQDEGIFLAKKVELATKIWSEQQEIIQFADAKANFNLVICTALFAGFGIGSGIIGYLIKESELLIQLLLGFFGFISFSFIVLSFLFSLWVVLPRYGKETTKKDFKPVPNYRYIAKKVRDYNQLIDEINNLSEEDLLKIRVCQAYELAKIADKKMSWASRSVKLTLGSVISTKIFLLVVITAIVLS